MKKTRSKNKKAVNKPHKKHSYTIKKKTRANHAISKKRKLKSKKKTSVKKHTTRKKPHVKKSHHHKVKAHTVKHRIPHTHRAKSHTRNKPHHSNKVSHIINQAKVIRSYKELQKSFEKIYHQEKKKGNKEGLAKLDDYKKKISHKVHDYVKDHNKITNLVDGISEGINILEIVSKNQVPKSLKKEVAREFYEVHKPKETIQPNIVQILERKKIKKRKGDVLNRYEIEVDGAEVEVEIVKDELGVTYNLYIPEISKPTRNLLYDIRNELILITEISMKELIDPKSFYAIKEKFLEAATKLIQQKLPNIEKNTEKFLLGTLMQEMLGLGNIEFLINDPNLEEIVITSSKENIKVYSKEQGWLSTNIKVEKEEDIINYSNIIARRVGRQITVLSPLLDAHLVSGDRINAVLYPVNTKGNTITIRKFARDPYTIIDLIKSKTCDLASASLLWLALEYEMNVLISGGTASGKTVFLNACLPFIPPNHRIISIEDTRELMLPDFLYWTPLVTRTPNPEGKGEVSMLDLLINSLRMRPDRIILGEMRKHQEAMVLFEAMHTGHSVYATVHADSAAETISRLVNPPLNVPPNLLESVNLNVVMFRDRKKGIRRVLQIAEIEAAKEGTKANIIYRWLPEQDQIIQHNESLRFYEDVSRNTGMSNTEINNDLEEKKKILSWLLKNNIRKLMDFGKVMNYYYKNKEKLIKAIAKNDIKSIIGEQKLLKNTKERNKENDKMHKNHKNKHSLKDRHKEHHPNEKPEILSKDNEEHKYHSPPKKEENSLHEKHKEHSKDEK